MITIKNLEFLLQKLEIIKLKYSAQYEEANFNIFSILRKDHDEVHLHSAFIAELLNPKGSHGFGGVFLEHFLSEAEIPCELAVETHKVTIEVERRSSEYGQIDILVRIPGRIIILENKIYAGDQAAQLKRYFTFALNQGYKKEHIHILYLTLDGSEPSPQSLGGLAPELVSCISYEQELLHWLTRCVRDASLSPPLRETIVQYSHLIKKLTGNSMNEANTNAVVELLAQGDNALLGKSIVDAWRTMKNKTALSFWREFEVRLSSLAADYPAFEILDIQKYSESALDRIYARQKGRHANFGLFAKLCNIPGSLGDVLALGFETTEGNLRLGLTVVRNGKRDVSNEAAFTKLAEQVSACFPPNCKSQWWLGWKGFASKAINLLWFPNEDTVALVNEQKRKEAIEVLYAEIVQLLEACRIRETMLGS
jgi:hypothetical protein